LTRHLAGKEQGRNGLVRVEGIAVGVERDRRERIGLHVDGLFVEAIVKPACQGRHGRLDHGQPAAGLKYS
jgi:hypothetical protein